MVRKIILLILFSYSLSCFAQPSIILFDSLQAGIFYNFPFPNPIQKHNGVLLAHNQANAIISYVGGAGSGYTSVDTGWGKTIPTVNTLKKVIDSLGYIVSLKVPTTRTLTINGVAQDLSVDRGWTIAAGVSSVTATSPITVSTSVGTVNIGIPQSSGSIDGYLGSTDWTTFNSKLSAVPSTTINGTSISFGGSNIITASAATLTSTTLNPTVVNSSLTSLGTISSGIWNGTILTYPYLPTNVDSTTLSWQIDGGGNVISTTITRSLRCNIPCTLVWWQVDADQSGSVVIDIKRGGTSIIGGGNAPTLTSTQSAKQTISSWTSVTIAKGDLLVFSITSLSTLTWFNLNLYGTKN